MRKGAVTSLFYKPFYNAPLSRFLIHLICYLLVFTTLYAKSMIAPATSSIATSPNTPSLSSTHRDSSSYALHNNYSSLLSRVVLNGLVDYIALGKKSEKTILKDYLNQLAAVSKNSFSKWSGEEQLAYYINLYNASTLLLIVENYPVKSIRDIRKGKFDAWGIDCVVLFDKKISLNHLEHNIIFKQFSDPRIHVALVCAAKGCPYLISTAYRGEILSEQLESQFLLFLGNSNFNKINLEIKSLELSMIFDWYRKDFESRGTLIEYLYPYLKKSYDGKSGESSSEKFPPLTEIRTWSLRFLNYDWSLNEIPKRKK